MTYSILAIDDIQDNLTCIKAIVEDSFPDIKVHTAQSGEEGIRIAKTLVPDIILLDIIMPKMDGFEVCCKLKEDAHLKEVPVVFLTAMKESKKDRLQALEAGAEAFLSKPVDVIELTAQIRAMLKIRESSIAKSEQQEKLLAMVKERTQELEKSQSAMLNVLEDLKTEIESRKKKEEELLHAQKMESIGRLAGGVAHDFNNMLGVILGQTELSLEQLDENHPVTQRLKEIQNAASHSAELTRQLLAFARKQTIQPKVLDINNAVEGMLKMISRLIGEGIDLTWIPGHEVHTIHMDPNQIDQILANLCINARDAMNGTGRITISTSNCSVTNALKTQFQDVLEGEYVLIEVQDTGCGMSEEIKRKIFEPFFTTKEDGKGTGLGLSTVYGIVKQNSGCITVESNVGLGTTFRILLKGKFGQAEEKKEHSKDISPERGCETILLVEDEPILLEMTKEILSSLGYRVFEAADADEAIAIAQMHKGEIDLLLTDVILPGMSGSELSYYLQSIYPELRCLFVSGYTADQFTKEGVLEGSVHFIQKPFSKMVLSRSVRTILGSKAIPIKKKITEKVQK